MPTGYASLADYYRAHRAEMELARELGCTPKQAARELRRRARQRRAACGTRAPDGAAPERSNEPAPAAGFGDWNASWMMRD